MSALAHKSEAWVVDDARKHNFFWARTAPHNPRDFLTRGNEYKRSLKAVGGVARRRYHAIEEQSVQAVFNTMATQWKRETAFVSSAREKILHPAYQRIIGLGREALPFIFQDLRDTGADWFWALDAITGADPVPDESKGHQDDMIAFWLDWAVENGLAI